MTRDEFDAAGRALRGRSTEELASFVEIVMAERAAIEECYRFYKV